MVATFGFREYNTVSETENTPTNLNFGSNDDVDLVALTYPVTAGTNSYEKWIKADFSGSFSIIDNIQFWKSTGAYVTGETIDWAGDRGTTFATPTAVTSTIATTAVPTADPGTANVTIGASLSGTITAPGTSDFIVMQMHVSTAASAGAVNQKTFTIQYDEV